MEFDWASQDSEFREVLRSMLREELPADWWTEPMRRSAGSDDFDEALCRRFVKKLADEGWLTSHWPAAYGGRDANPWQHIIQTEEMGAIGEPRGSAYMNVNWIGPAIMQAGTEEQKQFHLTKISQGETFWCQGFSEPDAGSDLASMRTRAVRDGADYIVNGTKIWTSHTQLADYCFLLVRTGTTESRSRGITILLVPLDLPGIEVRRIDSFVEPFAFAQTRFTDVRVPVSCRLGEENDGWRVVTTALQFERSSAHRYARAELMLDRLVEIAAERGDADRESVRTSVGEARADCEAARLVSYAVVSERVNGRPPGPLAYVAKMLTTRAQKAVADAAFDVLGVDSLKYRSLPENSFRDAITSGVAGGTDEIQLDQVATQLLSLPRS